MNVNIYQNGNKQDDKPGYVRRHTPPNGHLSETTVASRL